MIGARLALAPSLLTLLIAAGPPGSEPDSSNAGAHSPAAQLRDGLRGLIGEQTHAEPRAENLPPAGAAPRPTVSLGSAPVAPRPKPAAARTIDRERAESTDDRVESLAPLRATRIRSPGPASSTQSPGAVRRLTGEIGVSAGGRLRDAPHESGRDAGIVRAGIVARISGITTDGRWFQLLGGSPRFLSVASARLLWIERDGRRIDALPLLVELERVESTLVRARFEATISGADALRPRLAALIPQVALAEPTKRLEVAAGTALLAIGETDRARDAMSRALAADPTLTLDPATTSPKVLRILEEARAAR